MGPIVNTTVHTVNHAMDTIAENVTQLREPALQDALIPSSVTAVSDKCLL